MRSPAVQLIFILLAALSAFTLPRAKSGVREAVQTLFVPVSAPVRAVGLWLGGRLSTTKEVDVLSPGKARDVDVVLRQNAELVTRLANLEGQLDDLKQLSAQRDKIGDLRRHVHPAIVLGGSATGRQTLTIGTSGLDVHEKTAVVHPAGFVGQIYAVATGGATARVLLATDPASRLDAQFVRLLNGPDGVTVQAVQTQPPLVEGAGRGMIVRGLTADEVRANVRIGDIALLNDTTFPPSTRHLRLGTVRRITYPATGVGHATIELEPTVDLATLHEVLVVDR